MNYPDVLRSRCVGPGVVRDSSAHDAWSDLKLRADDVVATSHRRFSVDRQTASKELCLHLARTSSEVLEADESLSRKGDRAKLVSLLLRENRLLFRPPVQPSPYKLERLRLEGYDPERRLLEGHELPDVEVHSGTPPKTAVYDGAELAERVGRAPERVDPDADLHARLQVLLEREALEDRRISQSSPQQLLLRYIPRKEPCRRRRGRSRRYYRDAAAMSLLELPSPSA